MYQKSFKLGEVNKKLQIDKSVKKAKQINRKILNNTIGAENIERLDSAVETIQNDTKNFWATVPLLKSKSY